jgi:hypothetical protein
MTPEQKLELLKANVESSWFHFYTKFRSQLADCTANDNMLCDELEARLLPITFENLETVWSSLTPEQKARYAKPTGVINLRIKKEEAPVVVSADEVLDKAGELPSIYTRHKILVELNAPEYRALRKQYGDQAVENRVNGTE